MVTKHVVTLTVPLIGFVLAKKLMVTKLNGFPLLFDHSFVLAKKLMVTKQVVTLTVPLIGFVLAKKLMVTKP